jgi:hypothetical protein
MRHVQTSRAVSRVFIVVHIISVPLVKVNLKEIIPFLRQSSDIYKSYESCIEFAS